MIPNFANLPLAPRLTLAITDSGLERARTILTLSTPLVLDCTPVAAAFLVAFLILTRASRVLHNAAVHVKTMTAVLSASLLRHQDTIVPVLDLPSLL